MCWFPKKRAKSLNKRLLAFYALVENQLARVEMIERKSIRFLLREKLNREFPFGEVTRRDGLEHIAAVEAVELSLGVS